MTTLDLFADDPAGAPRPAPAPAPPVLATPFMMQPCGLNLWTYRGVQVRCDMKRKGLVDHWSTVEPLGGEVLKSDLRVALCKAINARLEQHHD